jgi:hypothetical protein
MTGKVKGLEKACGEKRGQLSSSGVEGYHKRSGHDNLSRSRPQLRIVECRHGQLSRSPDLVWENRARIETDGLLLRNAKTEDASSTTGFDKARICTLP